MSFRSLGRRAVVFGLLTGSSIAFAQTVHVGANISFFGDVRPTEVRTIVDVGDPATLDGQVNSASFGWSAAPCLAAVKIKFFRPFFLPNSPGGNFYYSFLAERGPFDVLPPPGSPPGIPGLPLMQDVTETVSLSPPVDLMSGDVIGITNVSVCGGPQLTNTRGPLPPTGPTAISIPGDVSSTIGGFHNSIAVFVTASGPSQQLGLLRSRFAVTLTAINPRTGAQALGVPNRVSDGAGYFSLPDFTGDATFPEVMVKMVDATFVPSLGGDFWFFHSPLTDVSYTLTVKDQVRQTSRIYTNVPGGPGQLCGGTDTSAFPGP